MEEFQKMQIKILLLQKGLKQQELAEKYGISEAYLSMVISGKRKSARVRCLVAKELGVPVQRLFPDYEEAA